MISWKIQGTCKIQVSCKIITNDQILNIDIKYRYVLIDYRAMQKLIIIIRSTTVS